MLPTTVLTRFLARCPAAVMVRATLERLLEPKRLDRIFEESRQRQYSKKLLFSQLVALMAAVATRTRRSVHAAYLAMQKQLGVSPAAVYEKLNHVEPETTASLVRETAADTARVIDAPRGQEGDPAGARGLLPRRQPSRSRRASYRRTSPHQRGAVAGAVLGGWTQRELIVEMVPCEDGHSQERSLLPQLLLRIKAGIVVVADRNFCTTHFLFGLAEREAFFAIRQHASTLTYRLRGKRRRLGRIATGVVYEQGMELHNGGATLSVRRVSLHLDQPTESGDTEIHIVTNLPAEEVTALQVAEVYGTRWTVEGAFQTLTDVLRCEVETLGYPRAALFSFATAVLAYNVYAVVKAAAQSARCRDNRGELVGPSPDAGRRRDIRRHGHRGRGQGVGDLPPNESQGIRRQRWKWPIV